MARSKRSRKKQEPIPVVEAVPEPQADTWHATIPVARIVDPAAEPGATVVVTGTGLPETMPIDWAEVGLTRDLPMVSYVSHEIWKSDPIDCLAIHCSDGRWGKAFDDFCSYHLGLSRYDRLAVPGGPAWIARHPSESDRLPETASDQIRFLVECHGIERLVLITHHGCAFYTHRFAQEADEVLPTQLEELQTAASRLGVMFPDITIEGYLAMREGSRLNFCHVDLDYNTVRAEG